MENLVESLEYRGSTINIFYDTDAQSPDQWGNKDVFIVYDHRSFTITREGFDPDDIWEEFKTKKLYDDYWIFPLYAYIHSGVSLSLGRGYDRWDTSMKGFVLVKRQKKWSWKEDQAEKIAESMAEEWNTYLSGDVYGYDCDSGSCWGFYGSESFKEMYDEAKHQIDYDIRQEQLKHFIRLKNWITSKTPFQYRTSLI